MECDTSFEVDEFYDEIEKELIDYWKWDRDSLAMSSD